MLNKISRLSPLILLGVLTACQPPVDPTPPTAVSPKATLIGRMATLTNFPSTNVAPRNVRIYLPANYATSTENYPVLYFHDGQNLFLDSEAAFGVAWHLDAAYDNLVTQGLIRPAILVAIDNTAARVDEYTPTFEATYAKAGGKVDLYGKFIIDELKPWVDKNYRTLTGPADTGIIGSSLGGLASLYISWNHPEVFGLAGCMSPSLWWDNAAFLLKTFSAAHKNIRYWVDAGTAEGNNQPDGRSAMLWNARILAESLYDDGWSESVDLAYQEGVGQPHDESAWGKRISDALLFFLAKTPPVLTGLKLRPFSDTIGVTGYTKTWLSLDETFDQNGYHLTRVRSNALIQADQPTLFQYVFLQEIQALAAGSVGFTASLGGFTATKTLTILPSYSNLATVTFNVTCPATTTPTIYLAGTGGPISAANAWNPAGLASTTKVSDTNFSFTFTMPKGSDFTYKFTRTGVWATNEVIIGNRVYTNPGTDDVVNLTIGTWAQ